MQCPKCGYVLDPFEKECPRCAQVETNPPPNNQAPEPAHTEERRTHAEPVAMGVAKGGCMGAVTAGGIGWSLLFVGIIFSVIGLLIIGIPMILLGIVTFAAGPFIGGLIGVAKTHLKGPCPHCGSDVQCVSTVPAFDCPICTHRIKVDGQSFIALD